MNIHSLYNKYRDIILYGFFGICTTLVNVIVYYIMAHMLNFSTMPSTIIAWILAVLFAYITNRKWVFRSDAKKRDEIMRELVSFFGCRIATGVVDWTCMFIFVDILRFNDVIIKFIANVIVIILNYIASKLIIFKKKKETKRQQKNISKKVLKKLDKKQKVIFSIIALLIIGITGFNIYKSQTRLTYIEYSSVNEKSQEYIDVINEKEKIAQEFISPYNIIRGVKIKIGTHKKDNNSKWKLVLENKKTKEEVYKMSFNASLLEDNKFNYFEFDKNIAVNKNETYIIKIIAESVSEDTKLAFFKSKGNDLESNTLTHNNEKISGKLCLQVYGGIKDLWWSAYAILIGSFLILLLIRAIYILKSGNKIFEDNLFLSMIVGGIVFMLMKYFAIDSTFTDEFDNIRGGMVISNGGVLYKDYVTQHTPVVYYLCSIFAMFKATSVEQFRLFYYIFIGIIWGLLFFRHSSYFGKKKMFLLPIIECICITSVIHPRGHQILSDGIQGLCMVALLLEFLRYYKDKKIDLMRSIIISLCIWGSFGSAFISVYAIIWVIISVIIIEILHWIKQGFKVKEFVNRYYKLIMCMLIPLAIFIMYFYFNGALKDAFEQCYLFNREVYSKYTGVGENLLQPFIDGVKYFFGLFADKFTEILKASASINDILQLVLISTASIIIFLLLKKKKYIEASTMFAVMICSATRGYGFHSLPAWYVAVMICVIFFSEIKEYIPKKAMPIIVIVLFILSSTYITKLSENILYKQEPISEIEHYVIKNTKKNEEIMMDAYAYDTIYFLYKDRYPQNRTVYMLPWYMDWYEQTSIDELEDKKPNIVIFNEKIKTWGYSKYANAYVNALKNDYDRLSDDPDNWKYLIWKRKKDIA